MKKFLLALMLMAPFTWSYAQNKDKKQGVHQFTQSTQLVQSDALGDTLRDSANKPIKKTIEKGWEFTVDRVLANGDFVISFLEWKSDSNKNALYHQTTAGNNIYFLLSNAEYNLSAERYEKKGGITVGASTTLIKIRPGSGDALIDSKTGGTYRVPFDFANDFNLGLMFGWKHKQSKEPELAHNFLLGLGITSISVDSLTTQGLITAKSNQAALTWSVGYVFEYNRFQIGAFTGLDLMAGEVGRNWIYRNRPWIGVNLGFSIFKAQGTTEEQKD